MFSSLKFHSSLIFLWLITVTVFAQQTARANQHIHPQKHPMLSKIQADYQGGQISLDQKILFQFYAGLQLQSLPEPYKSSSPDPIKCGVPIIREYRANRDQLSPSTIQEIESMVQNVTQAQHTYRSPSGKFKIHYDTNGEDAVPAGDTEPENGIPDYVDQVAAAADSSWRHEVQTLGHSDPVIGPSEPYNIYFKNFNYYGQTWPSNSTTYFVIHNNFNGFPENTDPEGDQAGAIKVTVAHELKHAIQYANSKWYWPSDSQSPHGESWSEMDATLMEEVVYDDVNDYYNYIYYSSSIFNSGSHSIPASYEGVTWFIYFKERYGDAFWPAVWNRIERRYETQQNQQNPDYLMMLEAITMTLQQDYDESFKHALAESHLWHYASGDQYSIMDFGFQEKEEYPNPNINATIVARDSMNTPRPIPSLGAHYITARKEPMLAGFVQVQAEFDSTFTNFGLIGYFSDGSVRTMTQPGNASGTLTITTNWDWNALQEVGIVVTNSSNTTSTGYQLTVTSQIPEEIQLAQNYPNPFNPGTTIEFGLPEQTHVELAVYDIVGRKVATLQDEVLLAGYYDVPFNGRNLASGVYFYRLVTDQQVIVKKMTLIK
ncbi:MXAN_6640 family putative metalloprotease [Halalkalibaculum sp. DA384]|uniref:MXAN_6640 family putative metalloprotease n=1 Tax=Halalkalibaculum sp. DA384 TaxID=3373606 RepID=UPI0037546E2B